MLDLMYITNKPAIAKIAEEAGVDWIFVDMEFLGKEERQGGMDTVQNHHTVEDVAKVKAAVTQAKVLVRVNPMHSKMADYLSSDEEINAVIHAGADIVMLPYFKTVEEVELFIRLVDGRAKVCLLVETPEAASILEQIVQVPGIDMIHFGLNDMHLALGMKFMFQLLSDGFLDRWAKIIRPKGIQYGFGGLASLDGGAVPGRMILEEHYRLGSKQVIISRSFCNIDMITDLNEVKKIFDEGIKEIRKLELDLLDADFRSLEENRLAVVNAVNAVIDNN